MSDFKPPAWAVPQLTPPAPTAPVPAPPTLDAPAPQPAPQPIPQPSAAPESAPDPQQPPAAATAPAAASRPAPEASGLAGEVEGRQVKSLDRVGDVEYVEVGRKKARFRVRGGVPAAGVDVWVEGHGWVEVCEHLGLTGREVLAVALRVLHDIV